MGILVDGIWHDQWIDTSKTGGHFVRKDSEFRNWITADGKAGPTGEAGFKAEKNRYHLYVSYACPWANRTLIALNLKGLKDFISVSVVNPLMRENGWTFEDFQGVIPDPVQNSKYLHEIYTRDTPRLNGKVTVPVLYDFQEDRIVSNESADIIRMFNTSFDHIGAKEGHYYPEFLRKEIDEVNDKVYDNINNGVYKAGFATEQEVYEKEVNNLFESLKDIEKILSHQKYLVGNTLTEADIRLFTTLIRFEHVYYGHFKCNLKHLSDFPHLWNYTKRLYSLPEFKETINFEHIQNHYYRSHDTINPNRIVPAGPIIDWSWQ